jgi:hypothetical protein
MPDGDGSCGLRVYDECMLASLALFLVASSEPQQPQFDFDAAWANVAKALHAVATRPASSVAVSCSCAATR